MYHIYFLDSQQNQMTSYTALKSGVQQTINIYLTYFPDNIRQIKQGEVIGTNLNKLDPTHTMKGTTTGFYTDDYRHSISDQVLRH